MLGERQQCRNAMLLREQIAVFEQYAIGQQRAGASSIVVDRAEWRLDVPPRRRKRPAALVEMVGGQQDDTVVAVCRCSPKASGDKISCQQVVRNSDPRDLNVSLRSGPLRLNRREKRCLV